MYCFDIFHTNFSLNFILFVLCCILTFPDTLVISDICNDATIDGFQVPQSYKQSKSFIMLFYSSFVFYGLCYIVLYYIILS